MLTDEEIEYLINRGILVSIDDYINQPVENRGYYYLVTANRKNTYFLSKKFDEQINEYFYSLLRNKENFISEEKSALKNELNITMFT